MSAKDRLMADMDSLSANPSPTKPTDTNSNTVATSSPSKHHKKTAKDKQEEKKKKEAAIKAKHKANVWWIF